MGTLLGSTVFDSLSSAPSWVNFAQANPLGPQRTATLGLVAVVSAVTAAFFGALLPRRHAIQGRIPLLVLMVGYTVGGLVLLFAS